MLFRSGQAIKAGITGVAAALDAYTQGIANKSPDKRTPAEQDLLDAKTSVIESGKKDMMAQLFPILAIVIIIVIVSKLAK